MALAILVRDNIHLVDGHGPINADERSAPGPNKQRQQFLPKTLSFDYRRAMRARAVGVRNGLAASRTVHNGFIRSGWRLPARLALRASFPAAPSTRLSIRWSHKGATEESPSEFA